MSRITIHCSCPLSAGHAGGEGRREVRFVRYLSFVMEHDAHAACMSFFKREDSRFRFSGAPMPRAARDPIGSGSSSSVQWEKKSVGGDAIGVAMGCEPEYKGDYVS